MLFDFFKKEEYISTPLYCYRFKLYERLTVIHSSTGEGNILTVIVILLLATTFTKGFTITL
jgi:hypothetical protein